MPRTCYALLTLCLLSTTALAAPATQVEADRIAALFQSYIGETKGVIGVKPASEAYDVSIDLTPLIARFPTEAEADRPEIKVSPWMFRLADSGNGQWLVTQDKPIDIRISAPGQLDLVMTVGSVNYAGTFDEKLKFFTSTKADFSDISLTEKVTSPEVALLEVTYGLKSMHYESTNRESGPGTVDGVSKLTYAGFAEVIKSVPSKEGETPLDFSIEGKSGFQDVTFRGFKILALYEAASWLFKNADKDIENPDTAMKAELSALLEASLPIFQNINMKGGIESVTVASPYGQFGLGKLETEIELNGLVKDGLFREAVVLEKLTMPDGIAPPFANDFIPERLAIDVKVTGFDAEAPTRLILADPGKFSEPDAKPELEAQLTKALLPTGAATVSFTSNVLAGKTYDLAMDGSVVAGPEVKPSGKGAVRTQSLIPLINAINALPEELGMGMASTGLIAFNAMAKPQADGSLLWDILGTEDGKFFINGVDYTALANIGGNTIPDQDPELEPEDEPPVEDEANKAGLGDTPTKP
ncbi:MAG: hypothetical protein WCC66_03035 [Rhizobiaceae bacterium]